MSRSPMLLTILFALLALVCESSATAQTPTLPITGRTLNIGHRGARSLAPENTLVSFRIAAERCNADMIELDVHLSRDGVPIVIHDESLQRTTDAAKRFPKRPLEVAAFDAVELLSLDAGSWFVEADPFGQIKAGYVPAEDIRFFTSGKVHLPTLKQALALIRQLGVPVNIEIKSFPAYYPSLTDRVVAEVRACKMVGRVVFSSFDHQVLVRLRELAPEIPRGALCDQPVYPLGPYLRDVLQVQSFNPGGDVLGLLSVDYTLHGRIRGDLIAEAHAAGLPVYVWTINEPRQLQELIAAGVDGIFTDFPQRLGGLRKDPAK